MNNTYDVDQVAKMMGVTKEQVRRWIRAGKLGATLQSRKSGYIVSESDLTVFRQCNPKYGVGVEFEEKPKEESDEYVLVRVPVSALRDIAGIYLTIKNMEERIKKEAEIYK